jgi:Anti-sigma-K factor rskA
MSPDFEELVGTDLDPSERARLERVHDLLMAAGPPPDYMPVPTPAAEVVELRPRRRRAALVAIAAALAVALFAFGAALSSNSTPSGAPFPGTIAMEGTAAAQSASASLEVLDRDAAGNWPMTFAVQGLSPAASGRPFELWLTRDGELGALCGSFRTDESGAAVVPMNAPYDFSEYDGWVVVEEGSETPLLTTA